MFHLPDRFTSRAAREGHLCRVAGAVLIILSLCAAGGATAAIPPLINYQAYLTDDGGTPLDGTVDLEFAIYDSSAAGVVLWSEAWPAAVVEEGIVSVALGSQTPLDPAIFEEAACWLETRVNGIALAPRRPFVSVPYALRALVAETALTGGGDGAWVVDGAHVYRPDGNVGVGTTAPTERFHAVSPLFARLKLERTGGTTVQTDASLNTGSVGTTSPHPFRLLSSNAVRVTVDTDGEVGVGTTAPGAKLDVRATGGQDILHLYDGGSRVLSAVSGGKIGIGTGTPTDRLQVHTSDATTPISGRATASTGSTFGGTFTASSAGGTGAKGTGGLFGLHGEASGAGGIGVFGLGPDKGMDGVSTATSGATYGGYFQNSTASGAGVYGGSGSGTGVHGLTNAATGFGVHGVNTSGTGSATGVKGEGGIYGVQAVGGLSGVNGVGTNPNGAFGVFGQSNATSAGAGVVGQTGGSSGKGVWGNAFGDALYGVYGQVQSANGWAGYFTGGKSYLQGPVGINTESPTSRLMVEAETSEEALRVRVGGATKLRIAPNGGVSVGANYNPPDDGMAISGDVGIATGTPNFTLHVNGTAGKPGGGSWSSTSDLRLKTNVRPLEGALDALGRVEAVTFEYIDPAAIHEPAGVRTGVIAQQVEPLFPDWVEEGADGYKRVTFRGFEALAIAALRELRAEKDAQIEGLSSRHHAALAALRAEQETELARARAQHLDDLAQVRAEHSAALDALRAQTRAALEGLRVEQEAALARYGAQVRSTAAGVVPAPAPPPASAPVGPEIVGAAVDSRGRCSALHALPWNVATRKTGVGRME